MSSWINRNSRDAAWYVNSGGTGTKHCMYHGLAVAQLPSIENDEASSFRIYSTGTVCNE